MSSASPLKVLIFGATGRIGFRVLKDGLLSQKYAASFQITAAVRAATLKTEDVKKKEKIEQLEALGAKFLQLDLHTASHSALVSAIQQHDILITLNNHEVSLDQSLALLNAAKEAGNLKLFVPNEFGFIYPECATPTHLPIVDDKVKFLAALAVSGVPYTRIVTGVYYEYILAQFGGFDLAKRTVDMPGSPNTKVTLMSEVDGAQLTAEILLNYSAPYVRNQLVLLGAETISWQELTRKLEKSTGIEWQKRVKTVEQLEQFIGENPSLFASIYVRFQLLMAREKGCYWNVADEHNSFIKLHEKAQPNFKFRLQSLDEYLQQTKL